MNKLWNSFLSVKETEDAPISLVLHSFSEDTVILALCRGLHLKVWTMDVSGRFHHNGGLSNHISLRVAGPVCTHSQSNRLLARRQRVEHKRYFLCGG